MKPLAAKNYPFTGNYFGYTTFTGGDNIQLKQYNSAPILVKLALSVNLLGELVIDSESKMQLNGRLTNIVDKNGEQIYDDGEWEIIQTMPILSGIGTKEGYRYRADLIAGEV